MLKEFLLSTTWPMTPPTMFSLFHILPASAGILLALLAACFLARRPAIRPERMLFSCGLFLLVMEIYKQMFLYQIVNQKQYDWWYFPFQLCSVPMYLCLLYPFFAGPVSGQSPAQKILATFLQDFGLLGGIMALTFPEGFLTSWWVLTIHGFLWHFLLIFIAVYCMRKGLCDFTENGFVKMLPLYALCCLIAATINTAVQWTVYPRSYTDLFYINCFFPSEQPLFHQISLALGNIWGHLAYMLASCIGAGLIHQVCRKAVHLP